MLQEEITSLAGEELQGFIFANENTDVRELVLRSTAIHGVRSSLIADQISGRQKARVKLPTWYQTKGIVYPSSIHLEQSSSEITARFKANLISSLREAHPAGHGVDLTSGFGVDSFYLSSSCVTWNCVDSNADLLQITEHNLGLLGASQIKYHCTPAEEFIKTTRSQFDMVFIDPSRRSHSERVFSLSDSEPNLINLLPLIMMKTDKLLIKASPLFDLHQGIVQLGQVEIVAVVAVDNECKEVLFLCTKNNAAEPSVRCVNFSMGDGQTEEFNFIFSQEKSTISRFSDPLTYLYEPNASILKAGAFKLPGSRFDLAKLQVNTHLFTSDFLISSFPGRIFKIEDRKPEPNNFKDGKVNVLTRNYPFSAEQLKNKFKLHDGGEKYLIGFSGEKRKFLVEASRLK